MRALTDATNVDQPSSDYPNGRVRDRVGSTPGTIFDEALMGDIFQFFQNIVAESNVTPNGLPDNVTNGYQLLEAVKEVIIKASSGQWVRLSQTDSNSILNKFRVYDSDLDDWRTVEFESTPDSYMKYRVSGDTVDIDFNVNIGFNQGTVNDVSTIKFSRIGLVLPTNLVPLDSNNYPYFMDNTAASGAKNPQGVFLTTIVNDAANSIPNLIFNSYIRVGDANNNNTFRLSGANINVNTDTGVINTGGFTVRLRGGATYQLKQV